MTKVQESRDFIKKGKTRSGRKVTAEIQDILQKQNAGVYFLHLFAQYIV